MANRIILNETSYFGSGAISELPNEITKRKFTKILLISDKTLTKLGFTQKISDILDKNHISYEIYDDIKPNPTIANVQNGVQATKNAKADCIVALGGGSPIDCAKAIAIIATNPEFADVVSLEGVAPTKNPCLPILAIPTTSGTAAEVTINYVITDEGKKRKFVCVDTNDIPVCSFVDSDLMAQMPKQLAAATGMDALTHAIEAYITKGAWQMSDMFALQAIKIIANNLANSVLNEDKNAREQMALAQYIAGMGFSNVGLGAVHAMAHPLSAWYDTPHGIACASLLPTLMRFNADSTGEKYRDIAFAFGYEKAYQEDLMKVRQVACDAVDSLGERVGIPRKITELGVKKEDIPEIAKDAFVDVCLPGNPKNVNLEDIIKLYTSLI